MKIITMDDWNPVFTAEAAQNIAQNIHVALEHEGVVLGFLTMAGVRVLSDIGIPMDKIVSEYFAGWDHSPQARDLDDLTVEEAKEL